MSPEALVLGLFWSNSLQSLLALALGFAVAGLLASGYQALTTQQASFGLLEQGERSQALAAIPFLLFAAPFIIIRYLIQSAQPSSGRNFGFAMLVTVLACFWSLMSGTLVVMALQALRVLTA